MNVTETPDITAPPAQGRLAATGSVFGALLASTCCIAPLVLLTLGVSGAWIGTLTALEPYKPYFIAVTLSFLALGFWQVYVKPRKACDPESYCASAQSRWIVKTALWLSTVLIILAATLGLWAPYFY